MPPRRYARLPARTPACPLTTCVSRRRDEGAIVEAEAAAHAQAMELAAELAGGGDDASPPFPPALDMHVKDSGGEVSASVEETNRCVETSTEG